MAKVAFEDISSGVNLDHAEGARISAGPTTCTQFGDNYNSACLGISYHSIDWARVHAPGAFTVPTYFRDKQTALIKGNHCQPCQRSVAFTKMMEGTSYLAASATTTPCMVAN